MPQFTLADKPYQVGPLKSLAKRYRALAVALDAATTHDELFILSNRLIDLTNDAVVIATEFVGFKPRVPSA